VPRGQVCPWQESKPPTLASCRSARLLARGDAAGASPRGRGTSYEKTFKAQKAAWACYQAQAPWYRRTAARWVMEAKKTETRERRLAQLIDCSAEGRPIPPLDKRQRRRPASSLSPGPTAARHIPPRGAAPGPSTPAALSGATPFSASDATAMDEPRFWSVQARDFKTRGVELHETNGKDVECGPVRTAGVRLRSG
jgi:hypothetical protein